MRDRRRAAVQRRARHARPRGGRDASTTRRPTVAAQIDRANEKLARVEQIKRFAVLPVDWVPGGDELTPTMKLKRKPIAAKYAAEIEALYA